MTNINNKWAFSEIPSIEEANFDKVLERFFKMGINGLVRENIQNSLDGKLNSIKGPVKVRIETGDLERSRVPGIEEITAHINSLVGRNGYTKEAITYMQKKVLAKNIRYISFEDMNTKGLAGARNGQSNKQSDTWSAYAYSKGVHAELEESEQEKSRGGSHGVGKIASNSASDIHLSYFANCDERNDQHLGGNIQLIEHKLDDKFYRSTGYFAKVEKTSATQTRFKPYENNFDHVFNKETRGLKIIIPFLRKEYDDEVKIIVSVIESFFIGIIQEKLEVEVNSHLINAQTIQKFIEDPKYFEQEPKNIKKDFTPLYFNTYKSEPKPQKLIVSNGIKDLEFDLYFHYNAEITSGRVAIVRTVGMKIEDFKVNNNVRKPFNAILIGGREEDQYLKSLENESHTALEVDHIKDEKLKKQAKKFIRNLNKEMAEVIAKAYEDENPTDGLINTENVLFTVENRFREALESTTGTVLVNNGNKIVKSPKKKSKVKPGAGNEQPEKKGSTAKQDETKGKRRKPTKVATPQDGAQDADGEPTSAGKFVLYPESVERLILANQEIVKFNLKNDDQIRNASTCNIEIAVVDGMGREQLNEFNLDENYQTAFDLATGEMCPIENQQIKGVTIHDGEMDLKLMIKDRFNRALKFMYYVEVMK